MQYRRPPRVAVLSAIALHYHMSPLRLRFALLRRRWSLGTLLFEMIAGLPPFYDKNRQVRFGNSCYARSSHAADNRCPHCGSVLCFQLMYRKILEAPIEPPTWMSPAAVDICTRLLVREPTARLGYRGADEVRRRRRRPLLAHCIDAQLSCSCLTAGPTRCRPLHLTRCALIRCAQIKRHPFFAGLDWDALDRREIPPVWTPAVRDEMDTANIASEFTSEPAAVTPSPQHSHLRDAVGGDTPPSFNAFTFTHDSVLDGQANRVSFAGGETGDLAISTCIVCHRSLNDSRGASSGCSLRACFLLLHSDVVVTNDPRPRAP